MNARLPALIVGVMAASSAYAQKPACPEMPSINETTKKIDPKFTMSFLKGLVANFSISGEYDDSIKAISQLDTVGLAQISILSFTCDSVGRQYPNDLEKQRQVMLDTYERVFKVTLPSPSSTVPKNALAGAPQQEASQSPTPPSPAAASREPSRLLNSQPVASKANAAERLLAPREQWEAKYHLPLRANTWDVIVASFGLDERERAFDTLQNPKARFPNVSFVMYETVSTNDGSSNGKLAIEIATGLSQSSAASVTKWARSVGIAQDAFPVRGPWDATGASGIK